MAEDNEEKAKAKPKLKLSISWILVGVLSLVVGGDLAIRGLSYYKGTHAAAANNPGDKSKPQPPAEAKKPEVKATLDLEPFLVNLADKDEIRFVKATFKLGLPEKGGESETETVVIASVRDSIISLLSSKTSEQILSSEGKDKLREEIRNRINALAPTLKVQEVFIVDFVVQL
jgi:flagellar protein FliL